MTGFPSEFSAFALGQDTLSMSETIKEIKMLLLTADNSTGGTDASERPRLREHLFLKQLSVQKKQEYCTAVIVRLKASQMLKLLVVHNKYFNPVIIKAAKLNQANHIFL